MRREFEVFLATLYTDAVTRARFLSNPRDEGERHGLNAEECLALERIDRVGLELAARSFALKRSLAETRRRKPWWTQLWELALRLGGRPGLTGWWPCQGPRRRYVSIRSSLPSTLTGGQEDSQRTRT